MPVGLPERVSARTSAALSRRSESSLGLNDYANFFNYGGLAYPVVQTTLGSVDRERVALSAVGAYKASGPVFALIQARLQVFSQVAFQFTRMTGSMPGDLFGTADLQILEKPWINGSTVRLLSVMEVDNSLAGNSYVIRTRPDTRSRTTRRSRIPTITSSASRGSPRSSASWRVTRSPRSTRRGSSRTPQRRTWPSSSMPPSTSRRSRPSRN
jgi:hypothetical protein